MGSKAIRFRDKDGNKIYACPYYPIGSIYISVTNINPATYFGGSWEAFGTGRTLVGVDTSQTEFNSVKKTGGDKTVILDENQIPNHTHIGIFDSSTGAERCQSYGTSNSHTGYINGMGANPWNEHFRVGYTGGGQAHNNLQPYITVYMWLRTA